MWKTENVNWNAIYEEELFLSDYIYQQIANGNWDVVPLDSVEDIKTWLNKPHISMESWSSSCDNDEITTKERIMVLEEYKEPDWSSFATFQKHPGIHEFVQENNNILCTIEEHISTLYNSVLQLLLSNDICNLINDYLFGAIFHYFYHATNRQQEEFYPNIQSLIELLALFDSHPESTRFLQFITKEQDQMDCVQHPANWGNMRMWTLWLTKMDYLFQGIVWKYG